MKKMWSRRKEDGSAIVIALLILTLLSAFVALAVTRTSNETIAVSNDASESRAFSAAQGSLEVMTRNFDKIFEEKLSPDSSDLANVKALTPPGFDTNYTFDQNITQTKASQIVVATGGQFQGLNTLRDEWQVETTATEKATGVQVALRRQFFNNRVPIFQFGIFYDDDLEFHPGPRFDFGGRVHSNGNLFLMAGTGLYFSSKVSAHGQVFTDVGRNGVPWTNWNENVFIKNGSGSYVQLKHDFGSVLQSPSNGVPYFASNPDMPVVYQSNAWNTNKSLFQGNLLSEEKSLNLPLKIASTIANAPLDYSELIKRGKNVGDLYNSSTTSIPNITPVTAATEDSIVTSKERYYNKKGIRISLATKKARLPGCASGSGTAAVATPCGVRLDGKSSGDDNDDGDGDNSRGYQPKTMTDGYKATRLNGGRLTGETWIKIELVGLNAVSNTIETQDVTEDILSLGLTEAAPFAASLSGYGNKDTRSILKLQHFAIPGVSIASNMTAPTDTNPYMSYVNLGGTSYNVVETKVRTVPGGWTDRDRINGSTPDNNAHNVCVPQPSDGAVQTCYAPFPIEMFDAREGIYNFNINTTSVYGAGNIPLAGVMSLIDVDVANLRKFLNGEYDSFMPIAGTTFTTAKGRALKATDVPDSNGWVVYVSDRRGDNDFDGEYDMEDVFGNNDNIMQPGEDVNNNGRLDVDFFSGEAVKYTGTGSYLPAAQTASVDHGYYRRAVRLINGTVLPGSFDKNNPINTKGFTFATENGVYVKGNYNATGINTVGTPTQPIDYRPFDTNDHIPASIVADAVSILSNGWTDASSFQSPFADSGRVATETTLRFAMLTGDARSSYQNTPNQGNSDSRLSGGVHNFKRFLENWNNIRLNYCGSLINLFNSHNSNGTFKNSGMVRDPPTRNWVFDTSFLDPTRLPPGTPFFQNIQLTGFQRVN
jgi:Tfp pilus assembly protein PilX